MANTYNYAQQYSDTLLEVINQNTVSEPFIKANVVWEKANVFHKTYGKTSGYKAHARTGGWNAGTYTEGDVTYKIAHDRDIYFLIDKADVDETNTTAKIENVSKNFTVSQASPEVDARFFERICTLAVHTSLGSDDLDPLAISGLKSSTAIATYTKDNVLEKIKGYISKVKRYRDSLVVYVNSTIMNLLELALAGKGSINWTTLANGPIGIQTRVASIDGVPCIEVLDDDRFYSSFNYDDGFAAATGSYAINVLIASTATAFTVPKISSIYFKAPGEHELGDGYLYENRALWDTFVDPNGKDGKIDSVYVDLGTAAVA